MRGAEISRPVVLGAFPARPGLRLAPLQVGAQLGLESQVALGGLAGGSLAANPLLGLYLGGRASIGLGVFRLDAHAGLISQKPGLRNPSPKNFPQWPD